jgi:uncharacterized protein (DUF1778 family)
MSGGAKLKAAGKHAVMLGLHPEIYKLLNNAAVVEGRPLTQYITFHAVNAARSLANRGRRGSLGD